MLYLSKGMVLRPSTKQMLYITRCGTDYALTGIGAHLWLNGRLQVSESHTDQENRHLKKLQELGLVELSGETGPAAVYYLLARCVICPAKLKAIRSPLTPLEMQVWKWISGAGLQLSIGELVKLFEDEVLPTPEFLGKENAQALTMRLYRDSLIFDTTLEIRMESASRRNDVVEAVQGLLHKKRLILV